MIAWWHRRSLRFRLAAWYGVMGVVLLGLFSSTLYFFVAHQMAQPLDRQLRKDLREVRDRLAKSSEGGWSWKDESLNLDAPWSWNDPWFEVWNDRRELVLRRWPFVEAELERLPFAPAAGQETLSVFSVAPDLRLRVLSTPFSTEVPYDQWTLRVMRVHRPAAEPLDTLFLIIAIALPVVVALLVTGGYLITRHWLRPLHEMVAEAEQIEAVDLSRRLPVVNPQDEIGRLAEVFNATLDRLQNAFVTLDRFAADASHELRTPLNTLRNVGEIALQRSRTTGDYQETISSMLEEAQRMQRLVERLLQLARASGGDLPVHREPVALSSLIQECVGEMSVLQEERAQRIELDLTSGVARADPVLLRQALLNLIDNAIKFSPTHSTIRISLRDEDEVWALSVADQGPGVAPEWHSRITDRFFRADAARTAGGFGLGLAITKTYLHLMEGQLRYASVEPHGSVFTLVLPKTERNPANP